MASLITVRLNRGDAPSWGFRLQGGKDFGTPLVVQKVNVGSPAERAGLVAGDSVIKINHTDVFDLRHKDAQDVVIRAGPNFEMTVQRGGSTWKPHITPTGSFPTHSPSINNVSPVTKTSLKHTRQEDIGAIGTGHNVSAKPFNAVNGAVNGGPRLVNKQYNTPLNLYSDQSIAETLAAQSEVLSTGALGVNFKKNEKDYDATNSAVFRMLQEVEKEPRTPEGVNRSDFYATHSHAIGGRKTVSPRLVTPSEDFNRANNSQQGESPRPDTNPGDQQGVTTCTDCERVIVGVFVRIKDKNLHVECFKCATCGTSLKNAGYYNINNKLYCDIHAKLAASANRPAPNLVPITVPPGGKAPANAISSALAFHSSLPTPSPASPKLNNYGSPYQGNVTSPRQFSSVSAPLSPPRAAPLSPVAPVPAPTYSPISSSGRFSSSKPAGSLFKGYGAGRQTGAIGVAPRRGRGVLNAAALAGSRIPLCGQCHSQIRGPFITALGKIWCPDHFICTTPSCRRPLHEIGFIEERGQLYCEYCFERYLAPDCAKCGAKIKGDCLKAIGKNFHPECFNCVYCGKLFGNNPFFLEDGSPYCEADWNELFTTKCYACGFPIEAGDRWVEALSNNYHSQCFNCSMCKKNLEGQSFCAKGGRPYCKAHAR